MKTNLILIGALTLAVAGGRTLAVPASSIAGPPAAPTHACCAQPALAADGPLSDRSLYQLGATWRNDAGEPVTLASLRGRPVVIAMFFASCSYACPVLVNDLRRLREHLTADDRARTQFVLVSFDTERDTPEALRGFRERMGLEESSWTLLRGDPADVQELAMLLGVKYKRDAQGEYAHSNVFTVLNAGGEIVQQTPGLQTEISEAARAIAAMAK